MEWNASDFSASLCFDSSVREVINDGTSNSFMCMLNDAIGCKLMFNCFLTIGKNDLKAIGQYQRGLSIFLNGLCEMMKGTPMRMGTCLIFNFKIEEFINGIRYFYRITSKDDTSDSNFKAIRLKLSIQ